MGGGRSSLRFLVLFLKIGEAAKKQEKQRGEEERAAAALPFSKKKRKHRAHASSPPSIFLPSGASDAVTFR